ncbi:CHASE2 domain-containing sensor protein [Bradyrhizobium japonicum]
MEAVARNVSNIPTGRTYAGFALAWICVIFVVYLLCIAVFAAGHWITSLLIVLLTAYALARHAMWIGKRARRGLVRRR